VLSVQLRDFRSFSHAQAHLGEGLTVVHGPNGAGKSNFLEALYFGCTGQALRARNDRELVRFGAQSTRVVVRTADERGEEHELSVGYAPAAAGEERSGASERPAGDERPAKHMRADGAPVERLLDVELRPLVSVFHPDRLELIKGGPALRRAHLDTLVAALWPLRVATRRAYTRALAQRNALLAAIRAGRASQATLPSWDRELAVHAVALRDNRAAAASRVDELFTARAAQLGLEGVATVEYRPRSRARDADEFAGELRERLPGELQRGFGAHGPHRDELLFLRDARELRTYGSQGEQRLALLALLLAERAVLAEQRRTPLMLLDDVTSELDSPRRELLCGELAAGGQSVIATTDLAHVPAAASAGATRLCISSGAILQEALAA
jgi:DNA replication and repair protein RecF